MENLVKKLENIWFYYKKHLLIGLLVLVAAVYLGIQSASAPKPDYHIGMVRALGIGEEDRIALEQRFAALGEDINGDGEVVVQIHVYAVDLADSSPDAGVRNAQTAAALDADLVGRVSGLFLLEDPDVFQRVTAGLLAEPVQSWEAGLFAACRKDAEDAYLRLLEQIL